MNTEQGVLYLTLAAAALASVWLHYDAGRPLPPARAEAGPDLFISDPEWVQMNESGQASRTLRADRLEHLPEQRRSRLDGPRLTLHRADGHDWRVSAQRGWISDEQRPILLEQRVRATLDGGLRGTHD